MGAFSNSADRELSGHWASSQTLRREQNRRMGVFSESADRELYGHWASSQTLPRKQNRRLEVFSESADSELRGHWGKISDLRLCQESRIGEWEFSQSPPTANYVVIGASSQTLLGQQNPAGGFLRVCRQRTYLVIGRVLRLCQESRIGDWEFSQSPPTANYVVIGARSQTLRREQNRRMGVFSESADRELCGHWASSQSPPREQKDDWEFSQSLPSENHIVIGRVLRLCEESRIGGWEFAQSLPTENYSVIGQVLRVDQEIKIGGWEFSQSLPTENYMVIEPLGELSDSAKRAESLNGSFLRVCRQELCGHWGVLKLTEESRKTTGSFLRVCRQRTMWSLGRDLRLCEESRIGDWELSQSLPIGNYVVIGRIRRLCQESRIGGWEFSQSLPTANYVVIGRVLRLCQESRIGDWEFSQSPPTANYEVIGARSQTLRREQNRQTAAFSNYADRELCGDWGEFSDSAQKAE